MCRINKIKTNRKKEEIRKSNGCLVQPITITTVFTYLLNISYGLGILTTLRLLFLRNIYHIIIEAIDYMYRKLSLLLLVMKTTIMMVRSTVI